jgi:hypothetical protein
MRRFLALLAVAAIGAVMYVAAAPGSLQATGPTARQFAALKKQVAGLGNTVKTLKGQVGTLKGQVGTLNGQLSALATDEAGVKTLATNDDGFIHNCLIAGHAVGVSRFGDPTGGTYGYAYQDNTAADFFTSALDADSSSTPGAFFQAVAASCVSSGNAAPRTDGVPSERRASTLVTARH